MRVWFKCENPDCGCTWYDDGNNSFDGCPECGADFCIFDEEPCPNQPLDSDTKYSGNPDNNPRKDIDIFHAPMF